MADKDVRAELRRIKRRTMRHIGQIAEAFGTKGLKQEIL